MKKIFLSIILLIFASMSLSSNQERTYTVAIPKEWKPYYFVNKNRKPDGFAIELFEAVAKKAGIQYKYKVVGTWDDVHKLLENGEAQICPNMGIVDERKKILLFSQPTDTFEIKLFKRKESFDINSKADLKDKSVAVVERNICEALVNEDITQSKIVYSSMHRAIAALTAGEVDAICYPKPLLEYNLNLLDLDEKIVSFEEPLQEVKRAISVIPKEEHLLALMDKALLELKQSGEYKSIYLKWFTKQNMIKLTHTEMLMIAVVAITLLSILLIISYRNRLLSTKIELQKKIVSIGRIIDESLNEVFIFNGDDYKFTYLNHGALGNIGYTLEEMQSMTPLDIKPQYSYEMFQELVKPLREEREKQILFETVHQRKDASLYPVEIRLQLMELDNKKQYVAMILDTTQRKKAENELRQYQEHLKELVDERTRELSDANEKLQELDQMKSMFIASMSHELRTPLNSIIGFSNIILSGMTGKLEEKQKDYLGRISTAGKHLLSMIIDVIDISKIEAGHIEIIPEKFELQALLEEATEMVEVGRKKKNLSLKIELDHAIELYSDKRRVEQAVLNFLSNAVKFTEHGTITLRAYEEKERVVISISDTGIGFDDDGKIRLFKPFERLESHLKVKAGGTGLGLYLTKKIVEELLEGEVFVSSKLGGGSIFGLKIPKIMVKKIDDESKYFKSSVK